MMDHKDVFSYITTEEKNYRTERVPLTNSKDWNMYEHIQRCTNVANGWFHRGANDGTRPYNDIVTPVINVAFRTEGFDVKDIVPFVNNADFFYKSFLIKKFHPQWARSNDLDTFIDEVVESSIVYDLALIQRVPGVRPKLIDLKTLAFADQTNVMAGPICIKHNMTVSDLVSYRGKWDSGAIDMAIATSDSDTEVAIADDQRVKTPSKYIEVYELRGDLPETWLDTNGKLYNYTPQAWMVSFYTDKDGKKQGIIYHKGKDKPLDQVFKALKIDTVRSTGRACGRSIVETLFEPQVWNNYAGIKIKKLLDSAINVIVSDSEELGGQKLDGLKENTVLKTERGSSTTRLDGTLQNLPAFSNYQLSKENEARVLGSASEGALGVNPVSGTPFALENKIIQEGQGIHEYRQGKIATFFADSLYRDWFLTDLVKEMNRGKKFSEELSLDELQEIAEQVVNNEVEQEVKSRILAGKEMTEEGRTLLFDTKRKAFMKGGSRRFFEVLEKELDELPVDVMINIKGKQRRMVENADKLTNIIREILANPQAIAQIPGVGKAFNQLLEESGMSPIDFSQITMAIEEPKPQEALPQQV
jgi:hypothetical protein